MSTKTTKVTRMLHGDDFTLFKRLEIASKGYLMESKELQTISNNSLWHSSCIYSADLCVVFSVALCACPSVASRVGGIKSLGTIRLLGFLFFFRNFCKSEIINAIESRKKT